MTRRLILPLFAIVLLSVAPGATCHRFARNRDPLAPTVFVAPPTLEQIIYAVNSSTERVRSLQTDSATLSASGYPSLRASMALERPQRLRLRGSFVGPELDVGSNDEIVWFWAKSSPEPNIYYARHEQFHGGHAQRLLPIEPTWVIDAFGLVQLNPGGAHEGPVQQGQGRVAIRSRVGPAGEYLRTLVVDATYGWILEQQVTDSGGQLLAAARASQHRFYPTVGVSVPHHLEIHFPPVPLSFTVDVRQYSINQLVGDASQLWTLPQIEGYTPLNLAESRTPRIGWSGAAQGTSGPEAISLNREVAFRPRYRGYAANR